MLTNNIETNVQVFLSQRKKDLIVENFKKKSILCIIKKNEK